MIDPTILITANGYNTGAIYTVIPTDITATSGYLTWLRDTTKTRVNQSGIIENMGIGIPTFDYTDGVCPAINVETQTTNVFQRSEDLSNSYWTKTGATVTANTQTAPDNTLTADSLIATNTTGNHDVSRVISTSGGTPPLRFVASFYVKKGNVDYVYIQGTASVWLGSCIVNLNNGVVESTTGNSPKVIVTLINGYYRISMAIERVTSGNATVRFGMTSSPTSITSALTTSDFTYMWGFQWELQENRSGYNPTSYIPTTTSSVTRSSDNIVTLEPDMLQYVNSEQGTIFAKVNFKTYDSDSNFVTLVFTDNFICTIYSTQQNKIGGKYGFSSTLVNILSTNSYTDGVLKIAFAYNQNDFVLYINGVQIGVYNSGSTGKAPIRIRFGGGNSSSYNKSQNSLIYGAVYNQRLSNSDLATLTTL